MKDSFKTRMTVLAQAVLLSIAGSAYADDTTALEYASVSELSAQMERNELTSVALVKHLQARIETLDKQGPAIRAIMELNPQAIDIATALDQERQDGQVRGPLHGIPVLLKDNIDTADLMQTSAGSLAMVGQPASNDAFIVKQLRDAGAVILGKTNMSEWAYVREMGLPHGWSGRGGQGKNPHVLDGEICGSSSGSAAGVAAGFAPLSIGTETNGSITCPASANGVVGVKPTLGLFSRSGIIPITRLQDTAGTLTRTVQDAALMFNALQGVDASDATIDDVPVGVDYTALLSTVALSGKRIGYPVEYLGPDGRELQPSVEFTQAMATLEAQGATVVPLKVRLPDIANYFPVLMAGMKHELPEYLASRSGLSIQTFQDLIDFNALNPGPEGYGQQMLDAINKLDMSHAQASELFTAINASFKEAIDEQLTEHNLDAMVADADGFSQFSAAVAGYPAITLPSGMTDDGIPTSLFFYGPRWSEPKLLALAYSYEQASLKRQNPAFQQP
ncbi:amidase family protein [Pseudomonas frederiksbergensis]|uniref:amidase family protein n=1 Tax=Pseudomonas frederiksbergensis TaxID=104087 RepID=UPI000F4979D5|nr:amidase family protein [Pseudomonas frederiksbergensis]RON47557.1 amidase [Pseudomonas frederiksbergensis]